MPSPARQANNPNAISKQAAPTMQSRHPDLGLPDELQSMLLFRLVSSTAPLQAAQSLGNLALCCTHWSLRVRTFIGSADGQALRRDVEAERFRKQHQMSPLDATRATLASAHMIHNEFPIASRMNNKTAISCMNECITDLTTSAAPVHLQLEPGMQWLNEAMCKALATRGSKLTILEFVFISAESVGEIVKAIQQVPRGGFVALLICSTDFSELDTAALFKAIAAQPVVCHLALTANKEIESGKQVCDWLTELAKHQTGIESLSLQSCKFDEQSSDQLAAAIGALAEVRELEIDEQAHEPTQKKILDAVHARNASGATKLILHFNQLAQGSIFGAAANDEVFSGQGIMIRKPGEMWTIKPAPEATPEKSLDVDDSIEVGSSSEDDDSWGSEFDSDHDAAPDFDSDSLVVSSDESDSESPS
jgi:hypothetical protein